MGSEEYGMDSGYLTEDEVHVGDLTWREQEILILLAERQTNREIANQLHLAESTVKDYVGNILSKLYVKNRRQAVERAKSLGLLEGSRDFELRPKINLPAEPTPFVGRKAELEQIKNQLGETRLLSLTGPGGIGKTRLALKSAKEAAADFEDGVYFVPLAPINSSEHLIQTIAEAVKFPLATHENPQHQLIRYLQKKQLLLVMDNFEHLLDGAEIISDILPAAPEVKILATSREKLNLRSENIFIVGGMSFPDPDDITGDDASILFVQSANRVCPGFAPTSIELRQIANICHMLQGMPLAIELAAAWLQILTLDEITEEIGRGLDILTSEVRDAPERHRSIRSVFDHSWSLLQQSEREIFLRLSIFRGGFTKQAVQHVSGATLQQLMGLVNKSLLSHDPDTGRLEMHELLRQYVHERLEQNPQAYTSAQEAHAAFYAEFMQERWGQLKGVRQLLAIAEIEADIENVRSAWRYSLEHSNSSQTLKFIKGLWLVHWIRSWNLAGTKLFAEAAFIQKENEIEDDAALRALAMAFQGFFMAWLNLSEQGYTLAKAGVDILREINFPEELVIAIDSVIVNAYFLNMYQEQIEGCNEMYKIAQEIGDKWLLSLSLYSVSLAAVVSEDFAKARHAAEAQLNLCEETGDVIGTALPLIVLGHAALAQGRFEQAREYYLRSKKISQETGFLYAFQTSTKYLGKVDLSMGIIFEADQYLQLCLTMTVEIGFERDIINLSYEFARLWVAKGQIEQAVELLAFVLQHPLSYQSRMLEGRIRDSAEQLLTKLESELDQEVYLAAIERGEEKEMEAVVAELVGSN
jgi:predicted ATPase/DNA-binding CsgD family transcriptional regulator